MNKYLLPALVTLLMAPLVQADYATQVPLTSMELPELRASPDMTPAVPRNMSAGLAPRNRSIVSADMKAVGADVK